MYSKRCDLNCEVALREYITTTRQPKWPNQGLRDVLQSPMINIPPTATEVPVRCFSRGVDVNTVKYIHKWDIEFAEDVYQRMNVSQEPKTHNAHGVAIVDSTVGDQKKFEYKRGDRLWLYVDSDMTQRRETVRVINLRTFGHGDINLQHVCWFPNYQSRSDEFWAIGGASSSSTHHRWGIGQRVDCGESYSGIIYVPRKFRIPVAQARSLFRRRLGVVESLLKNKLERSNKRRIFAVQMAGHATESAMGLQYPRGDPLKKISTPSYSCKRRRLDLAALSPLIQSVGPDCVSDPGVPKPLSFSTTHKILEIDEGSEGTIGPVTCSPFRDRSSETTTFDITDPSIEADPTAITKARELEFPFFVSSATKDDDPVWEDIFASMKPQEDCSLNDSRCKYRFRKPNILQVERKHYHLPASKCKWANPEEHEHCVSRQPFPGKGGNCLLAACITRRHWCCKWSDEDKPSTQFTDTRDGEKIEEKALGNGSVDLTSTVVVKPWSSLDFVSIYLGLPLSSEEIDLAKDELKRGKSEEMIAAKIARRRKAGSSPQRSLITTSLDAPLAELE